MHKHQEIGNQHHGSHICQSIDCIPALTNKENMIITVLLPVIGRHTENTSLKFELSMIQMQHKKWKLKIKFQLITDEYYSSMSGDFYTVQGCFKLKFTQLT